LTVQPSNNPPPAPSSPEIANARLKAMRGKRGLAVFMLSPKGKMSPFQTAQMYSLTDANIFNIAIDGVFDDCRRKPEGLAAEADRGEVG